MAERRMFAKKIISSARFLKLPQTARLLYYDLGMFADDDGAVEAFTVLRMSGATEDDLILLQRNGFVMILNEDLVTYIVDWKKNNYIQSDRYHPSIYQHLLPPCIHDVYKTDTEVRLGKDSIGKDSIGKNTGGQGGNFIAELFNSLAEKNGGEDYGRY
jgi:hypothetical protein